MTLSRKRVNVMKLGLTCSDRKALRALGKFRSLHVLVKESFCCVDEEHEKS